jgi:hypothetical protein
LPAIPYQKSAETYRGMKLTRAYAFVVKGDKKCQ